MNERARLLRPVLDGDSWVLGPSPALRGLATEGAPPPTADAPSSHECVDHHLFQSLDGAWHLWGCIRSTPVGRILYRWEGNSPARGPWRQTGEIIRADRESGESLEDWGEEEWIQSPFVVQTDDLYYMFYGGHGTGRDEAGSPVPGDDQRMACQICLMTSEDGRSWSRHRNREGFSRLFVGPGETRDPCVICVGDRWHLYYAGYDNGNRQEAGFYVRTSTDLLGWSNWRLVHQDPQYGDGPWDTECPCVVYREGYYYLLRTVNYGAAQSHVFRSDDPFDFGLGDAGDKYVGPLAVAAPEIIVDDEGREFISSNH
ncbi:hypothetical protein ACFL6X_04815, partial [Candidatus Latescibacterota bacterium]